MSTCCPVPLPPDEFLKLDLTEAYEGHKRVLKLLTYQIKSERESPRSWMLKCPFHLFYIKTIAKVYPDAKVTSSATVSRLHTCLDSIKAK